MITDLLEKAPKLSSIDAQLLLLKMYESEFGIFDHAKYKGTRPLATVALHDTEENAKTSAMYSLIKKFADSNVGDIFKLNLKQFLSLPREYVNYCLEIAENRNKALGKEVAENQKILDEMKQLKKK